LEENWRSLHLKRTYGACPFVPVDWSVLMTTLSPGKRLGGVRRLRPYDNPRAADTLKRMSSKTGVITDPVMKRKLLESGYHLDDDMDNKSVYVPEDLFGRLARYGSSISFSPDEGTLKQAIDLAYRAFGRGGAERVTPIHPEDEARLRRALKREKASGAPFFKKKGDVFFEDRDLMYAFVSGGKAEPCVAYHRVQHGENGPKTRLVWGYPQSITMAESLFAAPLIQRFLAWRSPMAFGLHRHEISARLVGIRNSGLRYSMDYSGFDATVVPQLILTAFAILRTHLDLKEGGYEVAWDRVIHYFIHTPIVMPDSYLWQKNRGIPSGSYFTQLVDSIVNYITIQYCSLRLVGKPIREDRILVLGDDSIFGLDVYIPIARWSETASTLGLTINVEKSAVSRQDEPLEFLGHEWNRGIVDRPPQEVAKRLAYPERVNAIDDPRLRFATRAFAYASDSRTAHRILRQISQYKGREMVKVYNERVAGAVVTGHQEYLKSLGNVLPQESARFNGIVLGYAAILM